MFNFLEITLRNENETLLFAKAMAKIIKSPSIIFLIGDLGAGKTTFARGFLQQKGVKDRIKSPTYALVETYEVSGQTIHHFDFYRLQNNNELQFLGLEDYFQSSICLIEWPDKAANALPFADFILQFEYVDNERRLKLGVNRSSQS